MNGIPLGDTKENETELINRCHGCGQYMSKEDLHNAHFHVNNIGSFHMKEACVNKAIETLEKQYKGWHWNVKAQVSEK